MLELTQYKTAENQDHDVLESENPAGEMIPSVAIDLLISQREMGLKQFSEAIELLYSARKHLKSATGKAHLYRYDLIIGESVNWEGRPERGEKAIRNAVDGHIWDRLMADTGMYTLMSSKQREEWDRQCSSDNMPEITLENVIATFQTLHSNKDETFEMGVIDVFRALSWDYKTNNPCKFGKRIIISRLFDRYATRFSSFSPSSIAKLDDLAKVFYILEERPVPDHREADGAKFAEFFNKHGFDGSIYEGEFFSMRYYMKGSAHITFKRPDLVEHLNDIVARRYPDALPPSV